MSSNCRENTSADWSFCSCTRIFVVNCNVRTCRYNVEYFRQAFILSAGVDREITDYGWTFPRKSLNDRSRASSDFLWAIVHSSQEISLHFCTLPAISRSTPADEINSCLKYSTLWRHVRTLQLTTNMRVQLQNDQSADVFSRQLLDIGNGKLTVYETSR